MVIELILEYNLRLILFTNYLTFQVKSSFYIHSKNRVLEVIFTNCKENGIYKGFLKVQGILRVSEIE